MIEPSFHSIHVDVCALELLNDSFGDFWISHVGISDLVVMRRKSVLVTNICKIAILDSIKRGLTHKVVDDTSIFSHVDHYLVWTALPMR